MTFRSVPLEIEKTLVDGFWGPVTATLDWCEVNYQFSHYIAELANSFSNLFTIWIALYGAHKTWANNLPAQYLFPFLGLAIVGIGSFIFHATLLFGAQLGDELPMVYVASFGGMSAYDDRPGFDLKNRRSLSLYAGVLLFDALFTWSYYVYRNPIYHQVVFASMMLAGAGRVTYILRWSPEAALKLPEQTRTIVLRLFWTGGATFAFGFFVWNLDNIFCGTLTPWKQAIGWPAGFFMEGHSWWHVLTATGTYLMDQGIIYLMLCVKDDHRKYSLEYTLLGLPYIIRVDPERPAVASSTPLQSHKDK